MKLLLDTHTFIWWDSQPDKPNHHRDPFDRMLIAQANLEDALLLSSDPMIAKYQVRTPR